MARVTVRYSAQARVAALVSSEVLTLPAQCTVDALLKRVAQDHGEKLRQVLFNGGDRVHASVLIFVDGCQRRCDEELTLTDGMEVDILTPLSGG